MEAIITLDTIRVYAYHGCLEEETIIGSDYLVNLSVHANLNKSSQTDALERVNGFSYLYIKESSIYFRDKYGTLNSFEINSGTTIRKDDFIKQYQSRVNKSNPYTYLLLPISLGMVFLFFKYRKRKNRYARKYK